MAARQCGRIALGPAPLAGLLQSSPQHGVDLTYRRRGESLALVQSRVEVVYLGGGESRYPDVTDGREQVEPDLVAVLPDGGGGALVLDERKPAVEQFGDGAIPIQVLAVIDLGDESGQCRGRLAARTDHGAADLSIAQPGGIPAAGDAQLPARSPVLGRLQRSEASGHWCLSSSPSVPRRPVTALREIVARILGCLWDSGISERDSTFAAMPRRLPRPGVGG
jgi:hypothetical protein